jgi:hypothetical protein
MGELRVAMNTARVVLGEACRRIAGQTRVPCCVPAMPATCGPHHLERAD